MILRSEISKSKLNREVLWSSLVVLVLSLIGDLKTIANLIRKIFPETAKYLLLKNKPRVKFLSTALDIIENIVYKDGSLPITAREKFITSIDVELENFHKLVTIVLTGFTTLLVLYVIINFLSFIQGGLNPSTMLIFISIIVVVFAFIIQFKSPFPDPGFEEFLKSCKYSIPITLVSTIITLMFTHEFSIASTVALLVFSITSYTFMKNSKVIDKLEHDIVIDRITEQRLVHGKPVEQALIDVLGNRKIVEVYRRTYPFSSIVATLKLLEDVEEIGIYKMFKEFVTKVFSKVSQIYKTSKPLILMTFGFSIAMIMLLIFFTNMMLPLVEQVQQLKIIQTSTVSIPTGMQLNISKETLLNALYNTITYIPIMTLIALFMIERSISSSSKALKSMMMYAIIFIAIQTYVLYIYIPSMF